MLFNSFIFLFAFLPVCYAVFWALGTARSRYVWLAVTGYVFYGYWDWRFCFLMLFSTIVSYSAGLGFLRWQDARRRKLCMVIPITVDLLMLGFFKYANFTLDSAQSVAHWMGATVAIPHLDVVLPIGISFYTFHTISYIVDSYRGSIKPTRNFFEFAAYVSLFSQLVAGPIVRFRQIEEDLEALGAASRTRWLGRGLRFFAIGLVEKVLVADSLSAFVDPAMAAHSTLSTAGAWLAMLGYSLQLYFDFSGYSSMAVGLGMLFGLRIPQNFNSPYRSLDPSEFWRRWHISLSTCMRDYLYISMGGNRGSNAATYRNLMLTMLIGGLWHGAAWTFVVWGFYHAVLLILYQLNAGRWDALPVAVRRPVMLVSVVVGWAFFRATDMAMAFGLIRAMFVPTAGLLPVASALVLPLVAVAGAWSIWGGNAFEIDEQPITWSWRLTMSAVFGAAIAIIAGDRSSPFLYFQF